MEKLFSFKLNGRQVSVSAPPAYTLLESYQEAGCHKAEIGLEKGECGACTILMNGRTVLSCLVLISQADGAEIVTSEGFMRDAGLPKY